MQCPDEEAFAGFVQGLLGARETKGIEEHLDRCSHCAELVVQLGRLNVDDVVATLGGLQPTDVGNRGLHLPVAHLRQLEDGLVPYREPGPSRGAPIEVLNQPSTASKESLDVVVTSSTDADSSQQFESGRNSTTHRSVKSSSRFSESSSRALESYESRDRRLVVVLLLDELVLIVLSIVSWLAVMAVAVNDVAAVGTASLAGPMNTAWIVALVIWVLVGVPFIVVLGGIALWGRNRKASWWRRVAFCFALLSASFGFPSLLALYLMHLLHRTRETSL